MYGRNPTNVWPYCGCYVIVDHARKFLPQVNIEAHTTILSSSSRTTLTQTFVNPNAHSSLSEASYTFPLYDGVSVVGFTCTIGSRVIKGVVKERGAAKRQYKEAVSRGETAGLFEQSLSAADVFTTTLGNVAAGATIKVDVTYLGELKHDAEADGLRFVIPTSIAPRYSSGSALMPQHGQLASNVQAGSISITVDVEMPGGSSVKAIQSPSHPIAVNIGTTSIASDADPSLQKASASLSLGSTELDKDFILTVVATNLGNPTAILETHPSLLHQRALMTTLVPKFNTPAEKPEIVFICDRSGSMNGKMNDLTKALQLFLKSLPVGVKFNICSFGSHFDFLWERSQTYDSVTLEHAIHQVKYFSANYGGTEMYAPIEATFKRRYKDMNLEVFLLTDGEIWDQRELFNLINKETAGSKGAIRVFTLGVGSSVSHALIEGVARAGNGFSQSVGDDEKMDKKTIRMLKASLTPHVIDYSLEIKYKKLDEGDDDDFELVERIQDALTINDTAPAGSEAGKVVESKQPISLFDPSLEEDNNMPVTPPPFSGRNKFEHLPAVEAPRYLQTPTDIPPLFPYTRSTVYVLLSGSTPDRVPESVVLRGTAGGQPLQLEIPITIAAAQATTIHQLAARKAIKELEEGRGWLVKAKNSDGNFLKDVHEGRFPDMVEREAVRIGLLYGVGGKWTSFVAVEDKDEANEKMESSHARQEKECFPSLPSGGFPARKSAARPMMANSSGALQSPSASYSVLDSRGFLPFDMETANPVQTSDVLSDFDFDSFSTEDKGEFHDFSVFDGFITEDKSEVGGNMDVAQAKQVEGHFRPAAQSSASSRSRNATRQPTVSRSGLLSSSVVPGGNSSIKRIPGRPLAISRSIKSASFGSSPQTTDSIDLGEIPTDDEDLEGLEEYKVNSTFSGVQSLGVVTMAAVEGRRTSVPTAYDNKRQKVTCEQRMRKRYCSKRGSDNNSNNISDSLVQYSVHHPLPQAVQQSYPQMAQQQQQQSFPPILQQQSYSQMAQQQQWQSYPQVAQPQSLGGSLSNSSHSGSGLMAIAPQAGGLFTPATFGGSPAPDWGPTSSQEPTDTLGRLVNLQTFSGKWKWTDALSLIIGVTADEIARINSPGNSGNPHDVLATACAVVYLKTKLASDKDSWEMLADKARQWMEDETGVSADELEKLVYGLINQTKHWKMMRAGSGVVDDTEDELAN